ncbi:hypothetical protein BDN70DRAFT_926911 [Pholiota conissans]|uniref:Uncharacterized protein n=1 Tax=Pholiota conissans TaxID=109636 RepID=A0A9P5ZFL1_9AGAR|nr:hypothetical protein BDN70DRAFT_926911 [Pholiota conissans]
MAQAPSPPQANNADPGRAGLLSPLRLIQYQLEAFEGLPARPNTISLRRRRNAAPDPETTPAIPLQNMNGTAPSLDEDSESDEETARLADAQQRLSVILTVNRVCRVITITILGLWGGWSIMPAETKAPASAAWVAYICVITDWVVLSTVLDCTFPKSMDWYFRKWPEWRFLARENIPPVSLAGYSILNISVGLGITAFKYAQQNDQLVLTRTDVVNGSIIFVALYVLSCVKSGPERPGAWFFHTDYSSHIFYGVKSGYSFTTWWWICFRIHGIVKILRNRDRPEMAVQFRILTAGLAMELFLLIWFWPFELPTSDSCSQPPAPSFNPSGVPDARAFCLPATGEGSWA